MIAMELRAGEGVCIGPHTLRVVEIRNGEVVVALLGPEAAGWRCPVCGADVGPAMGGPEPVDCPRCGCSYNG